MKIRTKVIALLATVFALLILAQALVQRRAMMPSFIALERTEADTAMRRVDFSLNQEYEGLHAIAADWGNWVDTYQFIGSHNEAFVSANITAVALRQLAIDALIFVATDGRVVLSVGRAANSGEPIRADFIGAGVMPREFPWLEALRTDQATRGLLQTSAGIMLFSGSPILDGSGRGETRGRVFVGRVLSPALLHRIASQAQTTLSMSKPLHDPKLNGIVQTKALISVYRNYSDIFGRELLTLKVDLPRTISAYGSQSIRYASLYLFCAAIGVLLAMVLVLSMLVLRPLERMTRHAVAIGAGDDLSARLDMRGNDEISRLAREFDLMVGKLAASRRQLVDHSFEAGFAELAKGLLHNLGNAMTPLGVRLASLEERFKHTALDDMKLAVAALVEEREPGRRSDLLEFLRLGCETQSALLEGARADVEVISRQTQVVQSSIAEPMGATRKGPVIESVDLSDLVEQTLEIVPDQCRKQLQVTADESLRSVGPVKVARSVLRLILQNLIINSADAVRQAGRADGSLRVAATIVSCETSEELHLSCSDNGIGIAEEDIKRVFEKGFSTKSRDTNLGIGLHWCANAVAELGGKIWAASDGPGRGAAMHLSIPLVERRSNRYR